MRPHLKLANRALSWRVLVLAALVALIAIGQAALLPSDPPAFAAAGQTSDVFYLRSADGGVTFGDFENISTGISRSDEFPDIALNGNSVHVAWQAPATGGADNDVFTLRSTDGGLTFGDLRNVSNNAVQESTEPAIALSGTTLHTTWKEKSASPIILANNIFYNRSTDDGLTFGTPADMTNIATHSAKAAVVSSGSTVLVVHHDNGFADVFYQRSTDGGVSFGARTNLSSTLDICKVPDIAMEGSNVHAAWECTFDPDGIGPLPSVEDIFYRRSTDGGATFIPDPSTTAAVNLSNTSCVPTLFLACTTKGAAVAVSGNSVHVAWAEGLRGSEEIHYTRSTDGGATWSTPVNVSSTADQALKPAIAASGNNVYLAWEDDTTGGGDIYYRRSTDGGATFLPNPATASPLNVSSNPGRSSEPSIEVDPVSGVVHIAWFDFSFAAAVQAPTTVALGSDIYEFARGTGAGLWYRCLCSGVWTGWLPLDGVLNGSPAAVVAGTDLYVFARASGDDLWYRKFSGGVWGPWSPLGGIIGGVPSAVATGANDVYVFVRGSGDDVWYRHFNGTIWEPWMPLGGIITAGPTAVTAGTDIFMFARGLGNELWYRRLSGGVWGAWTPLGGVISTMPRAVATGASDLYVFVRGGGGDVWYRHWNGTIFEAWQPLGGITTLGPTAVVAGADIYMFAAGSADDLWYRRLSGGVWGPWTPLGGVLEAAPSGVAIASNDAYVFVLGAENDVWYRHWTGTVWENWVPLGGIIRTGTP